MTIDTFADERDFKLLEQDRFTFFVLKRVLALPCELILSDHQRLIICLSSNPFPVWIWTAEKIEQGIKDGLYYFWKNSEGKNVGCCIYRPNGQLASLGAVYTRPEYRRRHYAKNLVYHVTKIAQDKGYLPMLYTDADYTASNACYEKIGYILRGKLCTIGI